MLKHQDRPNGVIVCIGSLNVCKKYTNPDKGTRIAHITSIYAALAQKKVPNIDYLVTWYRNDPRHDCSIFLQPKGVEILPQQSSQLIRAAIAILEALSVSLITRVEYY